MILIIIIIIIIYDWRSKMGEEDTRILQNIFGILEFWDDGKEHNLIIFSSHILRIQINRYCYFFK